MKRSLRAITFLAPLVLVASLAQAHSRPTFDAYYGAGEGGGARAAQPSRALKGRHAPLVQSVDTKRGVPSFVWAAQGSPDAYAFGSTAEQAARTYLERHASIYKITRADAATARVASVHDTGRGAIVVATKQRVDDLEVFRSDVKLLLGRDLRLLAISGAPFAAASQAAALKKQGTGFKLGQDAALASAFGDMFGLSVGAGVFQDTGKSQGAYRYFDVAPTTLGLRDVQMRTSPRVKPIYFPLPDRLVPAYYLELESMRAGEAEAYGYVISAVDGAILYRSDLVSDAAFNYKVYAENDPARHYPPLDSPMADASPDADGTPGGDLPGYVSQIVVPMEGFNTNPAGAPDPWLPANATVTSGNNVKAYADHDEIPLPTGASGPLDGQTGSDPTAEVSPPGSGGFDYSFDPEQSPTASPAQTKASITQLFYTTNWLHDYWYDSGFDEAAGVAQNDNFGRGAPDGANDAMEAQAQDKFFIDARNNANMSTPLDGGKPRMQMFAWSGQDIAKSVATSVPGLNITQVITAAFGAKDFTISGPVTYPNDGGGASPKDGCEPFVAGSLNGQIALIDRGTCGFAVKALNAQNAGAVGVIIANNASAPPAAMGGVPTNYITIGSVMILQPDGDALKAAIAAGPVTATIARDSDTEIDGTHDNGIVAHEWGHYWHHRLVLCGLQQCRAMSEGWGDFAAMHMIVRENDDLSGAYATAYFAVSAQTPGATYFGIRRYPRSTDTAKNPLSFKHIANKNALPEGIPFSPAAPTNSQVHNAGEVWSVSLFDAYANLLALHPYDEAKRRMADYLVGGMKFTIVEPSYTQQRDGILAYVYASDSSAEKTDFKAFVDAFAKRGMGTGAVSPPIAGGELEDPLNPASPQTFNEVEESKATNGDVLLGEIEIDDSVRSCDGDGNLDADEIARLTVRLANVGMSRLDPSQVTVTSASPGIEVLNGGTATAAALDPYGTLTVSVDVKLAANAAPQAFVTLDVKVDNASSFHTSVTGALTHRSDVDEPKSSSAIDTVETRSTPWAAANDADAKAPAVWTVDDEEKAANRLWHGENLGVRSDGTLESPDVVVGGGAFGVKFDHAFSFEKAGATNFDGGVIEVKNLTDGGDWVDASTLGAVTGYGGQIFDDPKIEPGDDNPLAGRQGYVGTSVDFPARVSTALDFGTALANKTVRFRFRVGTDGGVGAPGWFVDNIEVTGANTPFTSLANDAGDCANAPVANAGLDQTVRPGATVTLDASASTDANGDPLTYGWTQLDGPTAALTGGDGKAPTFVAPPVTALTTLQFNVRVSDGAGLSNDQVVITVDPNAGGSGGAGGAGGSGPGGSGPGGAGGSGPGGSGTGGSGTGGTNPGTGGSLPFPGGGGDDDGCGCSTVGTPQAARAAWLPALAAGLALVRRRRQRRGEK